MIELQPLHVLLDSLFFFIIKHGFFCFDTNGQTFVTPRKHAQWSPYVNNGGTCVAVAGDDFVVIAADTRVSEGYSICTRNQTKVIQLTPKTVLASSGMLADINTLHKTLKTRLEWYKHQHGKYPSTTAIAQLLSVTLYHKRFFPYYTFNVLGGIDDNGNGLCCSYDAIGSFEHVKYSSSGTGNSLIQPLLDNQLGWKNQRKPGAMGRGYTANDALDLVKDCFSAATERDIYTGDAVIINVVDNEGYRSITHQLKAD